MSDFIHDHYDPNDPAGKRLVHTYPPVAFADRTKIFCDDTAFIGQFGFVSCMELHMARGSQINRFVEVSGRGKLFMERDAVVASHCTLLTSSDMPEGHRMNDLSDEKDRCVLTDDIHIGEGAFVGCGCIIMPGVTIGERAVIGAGCYLDKCVEADMRIIPWQNIKVVRRPRL